ncbi:MAG: sporulation protein YunB [Eubacteriales bacterium]|nr:sporulation protein YunB [Eubacteriales bacterium]
MRLRIRISKKWIAIILVILVIIGYVAVDNAVKPTILSMSEAKLRALAVKAMNSAVQETIGNEITYTDLINIEKDEAGRITLVTANAAFMNNLAADTALAAQDNIANLGEQGISIPIGTIIGGQLLTGRGPSVRVKFEPIGSVTTDFMTEFEDAGINQTRHKIYLILTTIVKIVVGNASQVVEISSQVLISETIIIGDVPDTYMRFDSEDELLNLLPNGQLY